MNLNDIAKRTVETLQTNYGKSLPTSWIYAQLAHETDGGQSELAKNYNNFAGLTQLEDNGLPQPDGSNFYMSFNSPEDFADYFAGYLNKYTENGLFNATDIKGYVTALKQGGYFGDDVDNYVNGMNNWIGSAGFDDVAMVAHNALDPNAPLDITMPTEEKQKEEVVDKATFEDKFFDFLYDSSIWGAFRTLAVTKDMANDDGFKITQEDIDEVQKQLNGDYAATLYVCQNAKSYSQLQKLTKMKQEDLERRKRVNNSDFFELESLGFILGGALDPLNYVPLTAVSGKANTIGHYLKLAGANAAFNIAERSLTKNVSGYDQNIPMAAALGSIAGGFVPLGFDMTGKVLSKTVNAGLDLMGQGAITRQTGEALAAGTRAPGQVITATEFLEKMKGVHDKTFVSSLANKNLMKRLSPKKGVYVVSLEDAQKIFRSYGYDVPNNARAAYDDATGAAFLIKDNIKDGMDIERLLWHEKGAHGLRYALKEKEYNKVIDALRERMKNPSPAMKRAMNRASGSNNPDEILGYLAEELKPSNPLMKMIRKSINRAYNAAGGKGVITDEEIVDILKASAKTNMDVNTKGYRVLSDGSTIYNGVHFSVSNPVNPANLDTTSGRFMDFIRRAPIIATPYLLACKSLSNTMRQFGDAVMLNPYMDKVLKRIPVEEYKRQIVSSWNPIINNYHSIRQEYVLKQIPVMGRFLPHFKLDFDRQVQMCYNAKYGNNIAAHIGEQFDPLIERAANEIKKLRDAQLATIKRFGILPNEWENMDDEMWRFVDLDALSSFITTFSNGKHGARKFLEDYAFKAAKRDVIRQQIEARRLRAWQTEVNKLKTGVTPPAKPAALTEQELDDEIRKLAHDWALGITDQNTHNRGVSIRDLTDGSRVLPNFQYRMPLDTSLRVPHPNGAGVMEFSFDDTLREFDFDRTVPYLCNRIAGETALSTFFTHKDKPVTEFFGQIVNLEDNIGNMRRTIEMELKEQRDLGRLSNKDIEQELQAFDYVISKLRGVDAEYKAKTYGDAMAEALTTASYYSNGGLMGINQLGELSGNIAYCGIDSLLDIMPGIGKLLRDIQYGREFNSNMDDLTLDVIGDEVTKYIWHNVESTSTRMFRDVAARNSPTARVADGITGYVKTMSSVMSTFNGLPKLEYAMRRSAQKQTIIDILKWVDGKEFGGILTMFRDPFSNIKLGAAGVTNADTFKGALKPYLIRKNGKIVAFDYKALEAADPDTAIRFRTLVDNQANRAVISNTTIGDANILKGTSPLWRIFFQFKDFTLRATHTNTMRTFTNHEIDECLAAAFSVLTTAGAVIGGAHLRARAKYPANENKRNKYLASYDLKDPKFCMNLLARTPIMSPYSTMDDISRMVGVNLTPDLRTSVYKPNIHKRSFVDDPYSYLGQSIGRLPALNTGFEALRSTVNPATDMYYKGRLSKDDIRLISNTMFGRTMLPLVMLREELLQQSPRQEKYKYSN